MIITVNGEQFNIDEHASLNNLLDLKSINDTRGKAIAVNNVVIPKTDWDKYELKEKDQVIIIKATQGG